MRNTPCSAAWHGSSLSSWRAWIEMQDVGKMWAQVESLSSWRAWIEIVPTFCPRPCGNCRSPHGERGLKCRSLSRIRRRESRSPHGERGLKWARPAAMAGSTSRSPHGERGLKFRLSRVPDAARRVALLMESVD